MTKQWAENPEYDAALRVMFADTATALRHFEQAIASQPERARVHTNMATCLQHAGRSEDAILAARRGWQLDPEDGYVGARLVHMLFAARVYDECLRISEQVLRLADLSDEDRRYAQGTRGWALMPTSPSAALVETRAAMEAWPNDAEMLVAHACALGAMCRWDDALEWIDKAIAASPGQAQYATRRQTLVEARTVGLALLDRHRSAALADPGDAEAWRSYGLVCARYARLDDALAAFDRANEIAPYEPAEDGAEPDPVLLAALAVEATIRSALAIGDHSPTG